MASQFDPLEALGLSGKTARIILMCVLCAGILLLLAAVQSTIELIQLRVFGHETRGRVIGQDVREESVTKRVQKKDVTEKVKGYYAVVSFTIDEGTFTIDSWYFGVNAPLYPTDSSMTVVYRPSDPEGARLQQEIAGFHGVFGPLMLTVFGIVFTGIGSVPILLRITKKQHEPSTKGA